MHRGYAQNHQLRIAADYPPLRRSSCAATGGGFAGPWGRLDSLGLTPMSSMPGAPPVQSIPRYSVAGRCSHHTHHPEARTHRVSAVNTATVAGRSTAIGGARSCHIATVGTASRACNTPTPPAYRGCTDRTGSIRPDVKRQSGRMSADHRVRGMGWCWMGRGRHVRERRGTDSHW